MLALLGRRRCRAPGRALVLALACLGCLVAHSGCTRVFYRRRADKQVDELLAEKDRYPEWKIDQYHIYPDPRSRFADWTNPDREPMPPDDPAAWSLSPSPQKPGRKGVQYIEGTAYMDLLRAWDAENRGRLAAEQAQERDARKGEEQEATGAGVKSAAEREAEIEQQIQRELALPVTRDKPVENADQLPPPCQQPFMLNLEQTVEMGFLNSREFQSIREGLYLVALPVTAERFSFTAQPFLAENLIRERAGRQSVDGRTNNWQANTTLGFAKMFSTGALLLANFANQTVYNLGQSKGGVVSTSTGSLDIIQPFLRGGGRAAVLEPLTQAERNLLYAIRDFMRYRQEYFVFFAAGQPNFIPGVSAGVVAISPATITTPQTFFPAPIAPVTPAGATTALSVVPGAGRTILPSLFNTANAPTPQGFLSTLGEKAQLVNQYKNIQALQRFLRLFQVYLEGGIVTAVQVGQVEQTLLRSIETVLTNQANYRISLDQLKQQLGLPMTVPLDVTDTDLRPMIRQVNRYENLSAAFDALGIELQTYSKPDEALLLRGRLRQLFTGASLTRGTGFRATILGRWRVWELLPPPVPGARTGPLEEKLDALRAERRKLLDRRASTPGGQLPAAQQQRLAELDFETDLGQFERAVRTYELQPWKSIKDEGERLTRQSQMYRVIIRGFLALVEEAFRERQDQIRGGWAPLPPACVNGVDLLSAPEDLALAAAECAALTNRLDLMNNRAQLVDAWRKIKVAANALLGTFNVDYHIDSTTPAGHAQPFNFGGSRTRHQLIMNMSPPLVRVTERNNYRSTLITYQATRRALMADEDAAVFAVRLDLRNLRAAGYNYHNVQKRNIELAYLNVDQALQAFSQPQAPPGADLPGLVGPTAPRPVAGDPAALTTQLLNTQNSLLTAQNDLYSTWINYLTSRMFLYRDMGVMPIDSRGVWNDASASCDCLTPGNPPTTRSDDIEQLPDPRPVPAAEGPPLGDRR